MSGLREQLQSVYDQHGQLTPALVVVAARAETHPLHSRFEWDDSVAGERYRQAQASELIRAVRIAYVDGKGRGQSVRAYQSVRGQTGYRYEPTADVAADPVLSQIVLMDMRREWKALQARYGHFSEFVSMVQADLNADAS